MFIPEAKQESFLKEIAKLNKKLAKYGSSVEILSVHPSKEYIDYCNECIYNSLEKIETSFIGKRWAVISGFEYRISEPTVKGKQDVEYLGMVEYTDGVAQIYSEIENLRELIDIKQIDACYHCNTTRARKSYFFFRENGQVRKIGSTCVHEWFGFDMEAIFSSYQNFITLAKSLDPEEEEFREATKSCNYTSTALVLYSIANVTNNFTEFWDKGVTAKRAYDWSTSNKQSAFTLDIENIKKSIKSMWNVNAKNDFEFNIVSALFDNGELKEEISNAHLGVACWAIWKAMFAKLEANKSEDKVSEYIGNVGDKVVLNGMMKLLSSFDTFYGETYLYQIETEKGIAKWFASNECSEIPEEGKLVSIKGTVKEHKEYKGVKETIITRCKLA
jgi:hypothetical protein